MDRKTLLKRNINLVYIISALISLYFWMGTWVFFYSNITDEKGIYFITAYTLLVMSIAEIPTGAISDLIGKKYTILIAGIIAFCAQIIVYRSTSLAHLIIAHTLLAVKFAFDSGTTEALLYDSVKEIGIESKYERYIAKNNAIILVMYVISSLLGGFIYQMNPGLPFVINGAGCLLAGFIGILIVEPIDTEKVSIGKFLKQNMQGFKEIFVGFKDKSILLILLIAGSLQVICWEVLDDLLVIEWGFNEIQLSIAFAILFIISAAVSHFLSKFKTGKKLLHKFLIVSIVTGIALSFSNFKIGVLTGVVLLGIREITRVLNSNYSSTILNKNISSKNRATTLSTYYLIRRIPYLLFSFIFIPLLTDVNNKLIAMIFGLIIIFIYVPYSFILFIRRKS